MSTQKPNTPQEVPKTSEAQYKSESYDWKYGFTPLDGDDNRELVSHGYEFLTKGIDDETGEEEAYAGALGRAMIENAENQPGQPLWFGVDRKGKGSASPKNRSYEHILITGQTGEGKSTNGLRNLPIQLAYAGDGMCLIDPGGSDSREFLRCCPEFRKDDIVWVDPTATHREKFVGFNFLETWTQPGDPGFDEEVEQKLWMLLPAMGADQYQRMKGVASNILRGLIRANHNDSEYTFTLIDFYFILKDEESRVEYADMVREEKISPLIEIYADQIAELGNDELEPLMRRLQKWVENPIICELVACRNSPISIAEIVESGKILVIRCNANKDVAHMLNSAATRAIWGVANVRPDPMEQRLLEYDGFDVGERPGGGGEHKPFYLFIDEFPAIVNEQMPIGDMLRQARKKKLGLILMAQQVSTLPSGGTGDEVNDVRKEVLSNTSVKIAYFPGDEPGERNILKNTFKGVDDIDQLEVDPYCAWVKITLDQKRPDAWVMKAHPPMPPLRGSKAVHEWINRSLDMYGTLRTSDDEKIADVPARFGGGAATAGNDDVRDLTKEEKAVRDRLVAKAVFDESIRDAGRKNGAPVPLISCYERIERYAGEYALGELNSKEDVWRQLIKRVPETTVMKRSQNGETYLQATSDALVDIYENGFAENTGGPDSWMLGRDAYVPMTELGIRFDIPSQNGTDMGDAIGSLDDVLSVDAEMSPGDIAKAVDDFRTDNPLLYELTDANDVRVEFECSTARSKKAQTLEHLAAAKNDNRKCWILGRESEVHDAHDAAFNAPTFAASHKDARILFYNTSKKLRIGGNTMYRRGGGNSRWYFDAVADEYVLEDSNGTEHARFTDVADIYEDDSKYLSASDVANTDDLMVLRKPFIADYYFDGEKSTEDDVEFIEIPENEPELEDLRRLVDGKLVPLIETDDTDDDNPFSF